MYSIREQIRRVLRSPCPLCDLKALGGDLCGPCEQLVQFHYDARRHCWRCLGVIDPTGARLKPLCAPCAGRPATYLRLIAGMHYAPPGDRLMRSFKAQGRLTEAGLFARLLWRNIRHDALDLPPLSALVPIPSGREAMLQRGLNPAGEIARELSRLMRVPLKRALLSRTREVSQQKTLNWQARQTSTLGLYSGAGGLEGKWVGLVDDVLTTGGTLESASEALLNAGACGVIALVAARTLAK